MAGRRALNAEIEVRVLAGEPKQKEAMLPKPFDDISRPSTGGVQKLADWLREHSKAEIGLADGYTVGDLISDLDDMADNIWSDGIDAMGEDA